MLNCSHTGGYTCLLTNDAVEAVMGDAYFSALNYSMANEDATVETEILPFQTSQVLAVSGSGGRVIPLASREPTRIVCVDLCPIQLYLTELRFSALRHLDLDQYLLLLGYQEGTPQQRQQLFQSLELSHEARQSMATVFESCQWGPVLYLGRWEQFVKVLNRVIVRLVGKKAIEELFSCTSIHQQRHYIRTKFPKKRWSLALFILGNSVLFNRILYHGSFPRKNIDSTFYSFYQGVFTDLFDRFLARDNFYLNLLFLGQVRYETARPLEAQESVFDRAQQGARNCQIDYRQGSVFDVASQLKAPTSFVSMSNVPSYLLPPTEQSFLQDLKGYLSEGALVVNRYYMRLPEEVDRHGFATVTHCYQKLIKEERTGMYFFDILEYQGG